MSSKKDTTYYMELQPGDAVQDGDQWLDSFGQWQPYVCKDQISGVVFSGVKARRPIRTTHQTTYEEVPGSRTTQQAIDQPQHERIAYEELQVGDVIQDDDEWQNADGRWQRYLLLPGSRVLVRQSQRARRPYKISTIQEIGDALATAQKAATQLRDERDKAELAIAQVKAEFNNQAEVLTEVRADEKRLVDNLELLRSEYLKLQNERDELREALAAEQRAHKVTMASGLEACKERDEACKERDLARSEVARLSTELWARKPLEDRVASLTEELAQAREASQQLLQTITDNADQFVWANKTLQQERDEARAELGVALTRVIAIEHNLAETKKDAARIAQEYADWSKEAEIASSQLQHERDEARAERDRLQEVVGNLYSEPTARQVQDMLRTWATELDWSECCFDSAGRDKVSAVQRVLVAAIERIEGMIHPEGGSDE